MNKHSKTSTEVVAVKPVKKPSFMGSKKREVGKPAIEAPYGWTKRTVSIEVEATLDLHAPIHQPHERRPVMTQLKDLSTSEIPLLIMLVLVIFLAEGDRVGNSRHPWVSIWGVLFEMSSAFGPCGLSLSTAALSTAAFLRNVGKCVVMVTMMCGRHRNLPHAMNPRLDIPTEVLSRNVKVLEPK